MNFENLIHHRFSCRKFKNKPVEPEKIKKIIEAGILAPTAVNMQPFHIFNFTSDNAKEALRSCTKCHFGAEHFLLIGAAPDQGWVRKFDDRPFADVDASIAATHMMLMAEELGLATTWVGYFDAPALKKALPQLDKYDLIAIFPIGYPDEEPAPRHFERKTSQQLVTEL